VKVAPGDIEAFGRDGALCLRQVLSSADVALLGWAIEPGDVVCFHMLTLHASSGVDGPNRRRVFSVRFLGDDIVHAPRAWKTSPDFPGLAETLAAGAPMEHPLFPLVWSG